MATDHGPERKELKAQWKTDVEVPTLSLSDVAKHKTKEDLWIVIHNKGERMLYDVTQYAKDHPGGPETLFDIGGKDATGDFEAVGHSEDAREIMHRYLVGVLPHQGSGSAEAVQVVRRGPPDEERQREKTKKGPLVQILNEAQVELMGAALGVLGLAWLLRGDKHGIHSPGGFDYSLALASAVAALLTAAGARYAFKQLDRGPRLESYAAYVPTSSSPTIEHRPRGVLRQTEYVKLPLIRKDEVANGIYRLVFALPEKTSVLGLPTGQHVAMRGYWSDDSGQHTVVRSYTPVSNNNDLGRLELLIRCYADGMLTGRFLPNVKLGDAVEFRGPTGTMKYHKGLAQRLGMIAGGTGITPMYQLIRVIIEDKTDNTQIGVIYANQSEDDILMRAQLDRFAASGQLQVFYTLDKPPKGWRGGVGFVTKDMIQQHLPAVSEETMMLLCGPPPMVNAAKKNLVELGFRAPGAVSKTGDQIFCF